ncbi:MAG: DNA polymerase III subunit delta' [Thermodesulfobacteriota bacterium]|nr:DNA polymerase III subunit delta' [Thermodesulfobacteriota bacterium]
MSFREIPGQERQIEIIKNAIKNDRVPHAYLFIGEYGIGKRLTALTMAKALNCSSKFDDSCDICRACRKIDKGNHPDITVLEPKGTYVKINQIRELQRSLQYKPYEGRKRVCIIPDAEKLTLEAKNALLKTLEEPPSDTILLLISASPHLLLSTINSRCQRLKFQPLTPNVIANVIKEKFKKDESTALKIASLAGGSLKNAYEMVEKSTLEYRDRLIQKLNTLSFDNIDRIFEFAEELSKKKDELIRILDLLKMWFRDLLVFKEGFCVDRLKNQDFLKEIKWHEKRFATADLLEKIRIINDAQSALLMNSNKRLTLEVMFLKLCQ